MNYIPPGNSENQSDDNVSTSGSPIPFLAVFGSILGFLLVFLIFYMVRSRYHHRQPQRDIEAATSKTKVVFDLQTLNNVNPSRQYKAVKVLKKQVPPTLSQPSSAEVCAICLEVLVNQDYVRRLRCKHVFHTSCIDPWFRKHHVDCPLCKSIFIPNRLDDPEGVH
ncbi:Hypothetical protein NCS54_01490400 [Fusarium falciforme]|uniref:Hypothetical protein n=1 Tax=Fusarium falciforme TaxID=195108 RepID=UPI002301BBA6|nr:Hypothetical protein NCS54_01490400 [Fusarium falciforme]WAO97190.1 Hypothetical protein NCS54_01490400 [Fusarium falciforme]